MRLTAAVTRDGNWYVAKCLEVEVTSQGKSVEEALGNLREALELYFDDDDAPGPMPSPIIAPVEIERRP
ncbi:MAG TPA: type II toxin-antitoxin system HicB family antitoxin [Symbiobacteriaceae bacterium]|nr:type II toxin-antitoxin system HicB family antitoxin [Symbiobacteriaceae bacterium]